jgi:hypothetical protein
MGEDLINSVTMVEKYGVNNVALKEARLETQEISGNNVARQELGKNIGGLKKLFK